MKKLSRFLEQALVGSFALLVVALTIAVGADCGRKAEGGDRQKAAKVFVQCMNEYTFRATCDPDDCGWDAWSWDQVEARCMEVSGLQLSATPLPTGLGQDAAVELEKAREQVEDVQRELAHCEHKLVNTEDSLVTCCGQERP